MNIQSHYTDIIMVKNPYDDNSTYISQKELNDIQYKELYNKYHKPYKKPFSPGRNDICSCGSGKKYKKCCLGRETQQCR
jgi:uncharacterized protein YchJ